MSDQQGRLLPESMEAALKQLPQRATGGAMVLAVLAAYASLLTWSIHDPSFNHATDAPATNILGRPGAAIADILMQTAGLASAAFLLPPAAWGWSLAHNVAFKDARRRFTTWAMMTALLAGALSALPMPKAWALGHGLGGVLGDVAARPFLWLGGFIEPRYPGEIGGSVAGALGIWMLCRTLDLKMLDVLLLLAGYSREKPKDAPKPKRYYYLPEAEKPKPKFAARMAELLRKRLMALFEKPAPAKPEIKGPREFWMNDGSPAAKPAVVAAPPKPKMTLFEELEEEPDFDELDRCARIEPHFGGLKPAVEQSKPAVPPEAPPRPARDAQTHARPRRPAGETGSHTHVSSYSSANDNFVLPPLNLLTEAKTGAGTAGLSDEELRTRAAELEAVLDDFGVKGRISRIHPGPVVTLYELEPARGTKSSRVIGLADDIARSMSALSARVAVIPGRDAMGIELPNDMRETVHLRDLVSHEEFIQNPSKLALTLGKTIAGQPLIVDLAKMPHLLIAGTTGSGKSVGINAMILSLLYRLTPAEARFIMIDPKMLELSVYDGIPHLLTPVVTDPKQAIAALKWTVNEMNVRYERMCKLGVRNINGYNQKVIYAQLKQRPLSRTVNTGFDPMTGAPVYENEDLGYDLMPYIIVVIDEMADLMMVAGKEIEYAVQRLSQMARAAGIHLIMATQRPSVDVVTGTIKANFPSRISYQVTSKIDSRTILGEQGAEQLLGAGDMLYMAAGGRINRAHGPFVADSDVERVTAFLRSQGAPEYLASVVEAMEAAARGEDAPAGRKGGGDGGDDLYDQAVAIVVEEKRPTTSYLQRRLGIGYNKAASLIERMEQDGVISPPSRTGKREVLAGMAS